MGAGNNKTVAKYRALGLCNCGRVPRPGMRVCQKCTNYGKAWYARNKAKGLCNCGNQRTAGLSCCLLCKARAERSRSSNRRRMIEAYGGRCVCCGESEQTFLAIDHINNDGNLERRQFGKGGNGFFTRLSKLGFPKDRYQLLCHNCNFAKRLGICPHKKAP